MKQVLITPLLCTLLSCSIYAAEQKVPNPMTKEYCQQVLDAHKQKISLAPIIQKYLDTLSTPEAFTSIYEMFLKQHDSNSKQS